MKHLHVTMDDDEYEQIREAKGDRIWREWLLEQAEGERR